MKIVFYLLVLDEIAAAALTALPAAALAAPPAAINYCFSRFDPCFYSRIASSTCKYDRLCKGSIEWLAGPLWRIINPFRSIILGKGWDLEDLLWWSSVSWNIERGRQLP
jgi:hypothetical protein